MQCIISMIWHNFYAISFMNEIFVSRRAFDLFRDNINAGNAVPQVGKTRTRHQTYVAGTDDAYICHEISPKHPLRSQTDFHIFLQ